WTRTATTRRAVGELADAAVGGVELVLQGDDPAGGRQGRAAVDQLAHPGGQVELVPGVAAVPAGGAVRLDEPGRVEGTQEGRGHADHVGGPAHRVRGVMEVGVHERLPERVDTV